MATTTITIDDTMIGTIISPTPGEWIASFTTTKGPSPPAQADCYLPFPWNRCTAGRLVLRDTAIALPIFSFNPQFSGTPGDDFFRGPSLKFWGDLLLECLPRGSSWSLVLSDAA